MESVDSVLTARCQEVIRVRRDFKCVFGCNCCAACSCCSMEISVEAPIGQTIGHVKQQSVHITHYQCRCNELLLSCGGAAWAGWEIQHISRPRFGRGQFCRHEFSELWPLYVKFETDIGQSFTFPSWFQVLDMLLRFKTNQSINLFSQLCNNVIKINNNKTI